MSHRSRRVCRDVLPPLRGHHGLNRSALAIECAATLRRPSVFPPLEKVTVSSRPVGFQAAKVRPPPGVLVKTEAVGESACASQSTCPRSLQACVW